MMNEILEIYEEKQLRKINKKYDDLEQSIKKTDERYIFYNIVPHDRRKTVVRGKECCKNFYEIGFSTTQNEKLL